MRTISFPAAMLARSERPEPTPDPGPAPTPPVPSPPSPGPAPQPKRAPSFSLDQLGPRDSPS